MTWVGAANANWSVATNWSGAQVPTNGDTVIFDGTAGVGSNTNSVMNLGNGVQYHIGRLTMQNYTATITISSDLYVDVLTMTGTGTIMGNKDLTILQRTDVAAGIGAPTVFASSSWTAGTISTAKFKMFGDAGHSAVLHIGATGVTVRLHTNFMIADQFSSVNWNRGTVNVAAGMTVTNFGTFTATSTQTMGNTLPAASRLTFVNNRHLLVSHQNQFTNVDVRAGMGGRTFRQAALQAALDGTDPSTTEFVGTVTQDEADTLTQIESGTLLVTGPFSQTKGDLTVMADTFLTVTSDFTESAESTFNIELATPTSGSGLVTVGGTVTLDGATLNVTARSGFSGDSFTLISNTGGMSVVGYFSALPEGAILTLAGQTFAITYIGGIGHDVVLQRTGTIKGRAWQDVNADGIQDAGETGMANMLVYLLDTLGNLQGAMYTDWQGNYELNDVAAGTYGVLFHWAGGSQYISPKDQTTDDLDSDISADVNGNGVTDYFALAIAGLQEHWDGGFQ